LIYGRHSHLFSDQNTAFSVELESAPYEESLKLLQWVLKRAVIAIHEWTVKDVCVRWISKATYAWGKWMSIGLPWQFSKVWSEVVWTILSSLENIARNLQTARSQWVWANSIST